MYTTVKETDKYHANENTDIWRMIQMVKIIMHGCNGRMGQVITGITAAAVDKLLDYGVRTQTPIVLCTTGLSDEQLAKVKECSEKVAILKSANMSLGINTLMKLLKDAAKVFSPAGYDVEIVEKHYNQKVDAPSGTALALADSINEACGEQYEYVYDRSQVRKKRDKRELGISAVRGGTIVGEHEIFQQELRMASWFYAPVRYTIRSFI